MKIIMAYNPVSKRDKIKVDKHYKLKHFQKNYPHLFPIEKKNYGMVVTTRKEHVCNIDNEAISDLLNLMDNGVTYISVPKAARLLQLTLQHIYTSISTGRLVSKKEEGSYIKVSCASLINVIKNKYCRKHELPEGKLSVLKYAIKYNVTIQVIYSAIRKKLITGIERGDKRQGILLPDTPISEELENFLNKSRETLDKKNRTLGLNDE